MRNFGSSSGSKSHFNFGSATLAKIKDHSNHPTCKGAVKVRRQIVRVNVIHREKVRIHWRENIVGLGELLVMLAARL